MLEVVAQDVADRRGIGVLEQGPELRNRSEHLRGELQSPEPLELGRRDDVTADFEVLGDPLADELVRPSAHVRQSGANQGEERGARGEQDFRA